MLSFIETSAFINSHCGNWSKYALINQPIGSLDHFFLLQQSQHGIRFIGKTENSGNMFLGKKWSNEWGISRLQ